ncbi:hypothetical protein GOODEAATRI_029604, partial [Goodea atripinnis]
TSEASGIRMCPSLGSWGCLGAVAELNLAPRILSTTLSCIVEPLSSFIRTRCLFYELYDSGLSSSPVYLEEALALHVTVVTLEKASTFSLNVMIPREHIEDTPRPPWLPPRLRSILLELTHWTIDCGICESCSSCPADGSASLSTVDLSALDPPSLRS